MSGVVINNVMRAAAVAALALSSLAVPTFASASGSTGTVRAEIDCPPDYVCIYPEINFGGQPWVRRAADGGVKDLPSAIRDRGSSVRNNSDRTARVYEKRNYSGRWVCVTRSGGSIHDLRGYNLNDQTRSLKINNNDCG
ncbi:MULTISPECIES: peptidase inhibitor family I36 protein [unclassified Streptomyces]|uniref:peptidase inhibitor family I36 protein n=1 Tax=unclassified Streptomyces TaxID=2593676 RepID=UPI0029586B18|nr:peptidase inhibitor family I36 protein [Streptomyces sp. Wh19]MDV9197403.1 peptidase inhibitor family I36 protein [Streptomyces sp. Wh19]WSX06303.1 peptidase inhibitor family I36 protein [Streptomyces sp. NBC_00987]